MRCDEVVRQLAAVDLLDDEAELLDAAVGHLEHCLRCQVEALRHRRLARSLRQLQHHLATPSPDLVVDILAWIDAAESGGDPVPRYRRAAYLAAAATAATAAGAAGALVIAARRGRGRLGLAG